MNRTTIAETEAAAKDTGLKRAALEAALQWRQTDWPEFQRRYSAALAVIPLPNDRREPPHERGQK